MKRNIKKQINGKTAVLLFGPVLFILLAGCPDPMSGRSSGNSSGSNTRRDPNKGTIVLNLGNSAAPTTRSSIAYTDGDASDSNTMNSVQYAVSSAMNNIKYVINIYNANTNSAAPVYGPKEVTGGGTVSIEIAPGSYRINIIAYLNGEVYAGSSVADVRSGQSSSVSITMKLVSEPGTPGVSVTGVSLNKSSTSITLYGTEQLIATVAPSNAANKNVTWSSDNTSVATVSSSGLVTAVTTGSAIITVTTADGGFTATCNVTVTQATPKASDFTIGNLTQQAGAVTAVSITPKTGKSDGAITIYYNSLTTTPPQASGTYAVTFNVAASSDGNWSAVNNLSAGTLTVNANVFNSLGDFEDWLTIANPNTVGTPYTVKLNVNSLGGAYNTSGSLGDLLKNSSIYVILDLSGSLLPDTYTDASGQTVEILWGAFAQGDPPNQGSCTNLVGITLPNVTKTGYDAFWYCTNLKSVTIPASVQEITAGCFTNCTSLTNITIPGSVEKIGTSAFQTCTSLTSITIPDSVTTIENLAFRDCTNLTSVTFATGSSISSASFNTYAFDGDLVAKYQTGGAGTYTRAVGGTTWMKQ